jgi:hypothetical protein
MGDCAVRPVRKGIQSGTSWNNYIYASGWRDGGLFDSSVIGN